MHGEPSSHDAELTGLEAQLAALAPAARIDRDGLMYAAGRSAATRRLRVTNRILSAMSVLLGGLLVMQAVPRWINEPLAGPAPSTVDAPSLVRSDQSTNATPTNKIADKSVALLDGPTNFRLLQLLSDDLDARLEAPTQREPQQQTSPQAIEPLHPRALLNQYLEAKPEQM